MKPPPVEINGAIMIPDTWDEWFRFWMQTWPDWLVRLFALPTWGYVASLVTTWVLIPIALFQGALLSMRTDLETANAQAIREVRDEVSRVREATREELDRAETAERRANERATLATAEMMTTKALLQQALLRAAAAEKKNRDLVRMVEELKAKGAVHERPTEPAAGGDPAVGVAAREPATPP